MKLLLVEDDDDTRTYLERGLAEAGHQITVATTLAEAAVLATDTAWDAMILDRMLAPPDPTSAPSQSQLTTDKAPADRNSDYEDSLTLLAHLRGRGFSTPVLILSALGAVEERVQGLQRGADDYLAKPFSFSELLARVEALARRPTGMSSETTLRYADLELDLLAHTARRSGQDLQLQRREFRLLECLLQNAERTVTRTMLFEKVWGYHFDAESGVIDVHVSRLRRKLDRNFSPPLLHTVRGVGYRLGAPEAQTRPPSSSSAPSATPES